MSISKQLINGFIESELELFKNQFEESPIPAIQEARSLSIAWICYYFKDSITNENSAAIIKFVDDVYVSENYRETWMVQNLSTSGSCIYSYYRYTLCKQSDSEY
ncbi:MAG: hypothetical protein IPP99_00290 [Chitinophagaceae bacterium]|nr:hypothetical protein [Chitinophagaceae bacterium]